jgi:hypothetical protein
MILDLANTFVKGIEGEIVTEGDKAVHYGLVIRRALLSDVDHLGQAIKTDAKLARYDLFTKISLAGTAAVDYTLEEITLMRDAVLVFPTLVAGQVHKFLSI